MKKKMLLINWFLLLIFMISSTGFSVYQHICYSSNSTSLSILNPVLCEDEHEKEEEKCCSETEQITQVPDDCCEHEQVFAKYEPSVETPSKYVSQHFELFTVSLPVFILSNWLSNTETDLLKVKLHPPNPQISTPLALDIRLAIVQSFLC